MGIEDWPPALALPVQGLFIYARRGMEVEESRGIDNLSLQQLLSRCWCISRLLLVCASLFAMINQGPRATTAK